MSDDEMRAQQQPSAQDQEAVKQLIAFVAQEVKAGSDEPAIVQKLVGQGLPEDQAARFVGEIRGRIVEIVHKERWTAASLVPAIVGGTVAAIVGGAIWGFIVSATDYEIGFMAWGVGLLSGFGVLLLAGGRKGLPFQVIAVVSSVVGILIGKYMTFYFVLKDHVTQEYGADKAAQIPMFSGRVIEFFGENLSNIVGGYDVIWVLLALVTAWRIPKGRGIRA